MLAGSRILESSGAGTKPIGMARAGCPDALNALVFSSFPLAASICVNGLASVSGSGFDGVIVVGITSTSYFASAESYSSLSLRARLTDLP